MSSRERSENPYLQSFKNFSMRGWPKVAAQFLSNLGIQRIGEDHLRPRSDLLVLPGQAWPSAGFSPGLLSLQVSWWTIFVWFWMAFATFFPRNRRRLSLFVFSKSFGVLVFPLFKCWKHPQGISLYFPFVGSVDWTSLAWNWRIEFFLGAKKVALSVDCRRWLHWHCM